MGSRHLGGQSSWWVTFPFSFRLASSCELIYPPTRLFNLLEWQLTDMACAAFSLVSIALYDTLGPVSLARTLYASNDNA
jgi:hypothetical protein